MTPSTTGSFILHNKFPWEIQNATQLNKGSEEACD